MAEIGAIILAAYPPASDETTQTTQEETAKQKRDHLCGSSCSITFRIRLENSSGNTNSLKSDHIACLLCERAYYFFRLPRPGVGQSRISMRPRPLSVSTSFCFSFHLYFLTKGFRDIYDVTMA